MSKSIADRRREREEFEHAVLRVGGLLLTRAFRESDGKCRPVLTMITRYWNRDSGTKYIQVLIVIAETGEIVDISGEVSTIIGYRYSDVRRGLMFNGAGVNVHHHVTDRLSGILYGPGRADERLTFRSL